jgi:hypothetical protein
MGRRVADGWLSDRRPGIAALGLLSAALRRVAGSQFDPVEWVVVRRDPLVYGNHAVRSFRGYKSDQHREARSYTANAK